MIQNKTTRIKTKAMIWRNGKWIMIDRDDNVYNQAYLFSDARRTKVNIRQPESKVDDSESYNLLALLWWIVKKLLLRLKRKSQVKGVGLSKKNNRWVLKDSNEKTHKSFDGIARGDKRTVVYSFNKSLFIVLFFACYFLILGFIGYQLFLR